MLRVVVLFLLLANGLYYAWSQGLLRDLGMGPAATSEPQRIAQQVRPQDVKVLSASDLVRAQEQAKADAAPRECLLAGPLEEAQAAALRKSLEAGFTAESWKLEEITLPARWIIYMGKYANADMLARKRAELSTMQLNIEALVNPALEIGLSLGSFPTEAAAAQELTRLTARGIRTARVVQERPPTQASQLRLPAVTEAMKPRVQELRALMAGKGFRPCASAG